MNKEANCGPSIRSGSTSHREEPAGACGGAVVASHPRPSWARKLSAAPDLPEVVQGACPGGVTEGTWSGALADAVLGVAS